MQATISPRIPLARVAAIVLAAGMSRRFGPDNKLLAAVDGDPLVRRVVMQARASQACSVSVVTGHEPDRIAGALAGLSLDLVHNPDFAQGMGTSVAAGIKALPVADLPDGAVVLLADMPAVEAALIDRLIGAFADDGARRIVFPVDADGRQRNPVLWPRALFDELARLDGDKGGRDLIRAHPDLVLRLPVGDDDAVSRDIDTPEALAAWREGKTRR